jgi:hypothetical protein
MASSRRPPSPPFVLDLVDFMDEKIREAIANEGSRVAAVAEAAGLLPLLARSPARERGGEGTVHAGVRYAPLRTWRNGRRNSSG